MNFGEVIQYGFKNYANFNGVASRTIYWYWYLFVVLAQVPFSVLSFAARDLEANSITMLLDLGSNVIAIGLFIPTLALTIRRLRDAGKSPLYLLLALLPIVLAVVFGIGGLVLAGALSTQTDFAAAVGLMLFGLGAAGIGAFFGAMAAGIWLLVLLVQPTKTLSQGNRYAQY